MASSVLQHVNCYTTSCSFGANVTAGSTIIVMVSQNGNASSILAADTLLNTFNSSANMQVFTPTAQVTGMKIFYANIASGGADTVTLSGTGTDPGMAITEVSGLVTSNTVDAAIGTDTSGQTPPTSSNLVTSQTDFIYAAIASEVAAVTESAGTGYILLGQTASHTDAEEYASGKAAGTYNPTFTATPQGGSVMMSVAFKESGATPPPIPGNSTQFLQLMGIGT